MTTAHKAVELLASGLEVLGTFLLAVEAIKLANLRELREGLFKRVLHRLIPRITVSDDTPAADIEQMKERVHLRFLLIFVVIGLPLFLLAAIAIVGSPSALWLAVRAALAHPPLWGAILRVLFGAVISFGVSAILGYVLYLIVLALFSFPVGILTWIETHTENGVIGILGFLVFFIGAGIHAYLNWTAP